MEIVMWSIVCGLISAIGITLMVVGVQVAFSNKQGEGASTIEDFVDEGGMLFIKKIDL